MVEPNTAINLSLPPPFMHIQNSSHDFKIIHLCAGKFASITGIQWKTYPKPNKAHYIIEIYICDEYCAIGTNPWELKNTLKITHLYSLDSSPKEQTKKKKTNKTDKLYKRLLFYQYKFIFALFYSWFHCSPKKSSCFYTLPPTLLKQGC